MSTQFSSALAPLPAVGAGRFPGYDTL